MNKDTAKGYLPLVQALADGKVIQERHNLDDPWVDAINPVFDWHYGDYRIKPEPKEIWINDYGIGVVTMHHTEAHAREQLGASGITRHYSEVIE